MAVVKMGAGYGPVQVEVTSEAVSAYVVPRPSEAAAVNVALVVVMA